MVDAHPKPKWKRHLVIALLIAVALTIGINYALQRRRLRTWVLGIQRRGVRPYILAGLSDVDPGASITNRLRVILSGWKCFIVVENQAQAEVLLEAGDGPLPLELKIKPGVPVESTNRLREKFPTADIEVNFAVQGTNPQGSQLQPR